MFSYKSNKCTIFKYLYYKILRHNIVQYSNNAIEDITFKQSLIICSHNKFAQNAHRAIILADSQ